MKIIVESKIRNEFIIGDYFEAYSNDYLEHQEKMNAIISEMEQLDGDDMSYLDDADKLNVLEKHASVTTARTEIHNVQVIGSDSAITREVSKSDLFESWKKQVGYNKAVLMSCNYPLAKIMSMSDEEAESEVEAIQTYAEE